jgi:hypothetical protein
MTQSASMTRVPRRPKRKQVRELGQAITDVASFRRLIHMQGDLIGSISRHRKAIAPHAVEQIVGSLMTNPIYRDALAPNPFPNAYSRLKSRAFKSRASAELEILWTAAVLSHFTDELNEYLKLKATYSNAFMDGNWSEAVRILDQIERLFGFSIWSINARITLTHLQHGVTAQKSALNKIIGTPGINPIVAYLAFIFSYSLEENVTLSEIRREFTSLGTDFKSYFLYHVTPFDLDAVVNPHACISWEENSTVIDRFETFVEMLQIFYSRQTCIVELQRALAILKGVADLRLSNLAFCLDLSDCQPSKDIEFAQACDEYTVGNYKAAADLLAQQQKLNSGAAWTYELAAKTESALAEECAIASPVDSIVREMQSFLDLSKDLADVQKDLHKLGIQTRKLPASRAIGAIVDRIMDIPISVSFTTSQMIFCLSCPLWQPANYAILMLISLPAFERLKQYFEGNSSVAHRLSLFVVDANSHSAAALSAEPIPSKRKHLYLAYHYYNRGAYQDAMVHYSHYSADGSAQSSPRTITFQYALLRRQDLVDRALAAFVDAYFANRRSHSLYSMQEITEWAVSRAASDCAALDRSILLQVYSSFYDSAHDGDLSDALEDTLDFFKVRLPSELLNQLIEHPHHVR